MTGQVQLALLLVIAAFAHCAPFEDEQVFEDTPVVIQPLEQEVLLDEKFDLLLPKLRSFIIDNGLDPMDVIDFSEPLLPDMPGKLQGEVDLTKGWMQNLSQMKRDGHVIARYTSDDKFLMLDMDLGFDVLDFNYAYHIKYLLFEREGDLLGHLHNLKSKVLIKVDLNKYHLTLESIKFTEVGKCNIKFEGHILDRILNAATKVVTTIFKKFVVEYVEQHAYQIIAAKISEWDKLIPRPNATEPSTPVIDTFDIKINLL